MALPERALTPELLRVRAGYLLLRDSLHTIDVAVARIQRDMNTTSDVTLAARARAVRDGCARSSRTLPGARTDMLSLGPQVSAERRTAFEREIAALAGALADCEALFGGWTTPEKGTEIRGYAVSRGIRTQRALRAYEGEAQSYLKAHRIKVRPLGAGPSPLAGSVNP